MIQWGRAAATIARTAGRHMKTLVSILVMILAGGVHDGFAQSGRTAPALRVGAAKVDVTPSAGELPKNSRGVLDRLYARAVVLDNGLASAALITVDAGAIPDAIWQAVTRQIETELGIPTANVLLTATHTHSAGGQRGPDYPRKIVESVRLAKQRLAPARVGYGTGTSYINVNRQIIDPQHPPVVGGPKPRGPLRQDGRGAQVRGPERRADCRLLQLRRARGDCRPARSGQRRYSWSGLELRGRFVRRSHRRAVVARALPATRTPSITSRPTTCARSGPRTTPGAASTSATRCRRAAKA